MSIMLHAFKCSQRKLFPRSLPLKILVCIFGVTCLLATLYIASRVASVPLKPFSTRNARFSSPLLLREQYAQVLITAGRDELIGALATAKSVISHTKHPVHFYFVTSAKSASDLHSWIEGSSLKDVSYEIKIFNLDDFGINMTSIATDERSDENWLVYSKFYIKKLFPQAEGILIYLDPDVIVQGDIFELRNVSILPNHFGALSSDCDAVSRIFRNNKNLYYHYLNLKNRYLMDKNFSRRRCILNLGVMVLNMTVWEKESVSEQLDFWHHLSERENIFRSRSIVSAFLIVFYNRISLLESYWHVRHLGMTKGTRYSLSYLENANLLQWNGHFKPWRYKSSISYLWYRYMVPKPKMIS